MTTIKIPEITITAVWEDDRLDVVARADVSEDLRLIYTAAAFVHPTCKVRDQVETAQIERALRGLINHLTSNKASA